MITPAHIGDLILWIDSRRAYAHELFVCWGDDYAPYCAIRFESLH